MKNKEKKIFINRKPVIGPWGGGNKTLTGLAEKLSERHNVVYDLDHKDIDVIFCFDPRPDSAGIWYKDLMEYREKFGSKIVQRVGDVGSHGKPDLTSLVYQSTHNSDFVIFTSDWARKAISFNNKNYAIIHNSPVPEFFNNRSNRGIEGNVLKVVTHHWSTNQLKGFETYKKLGLLANENNISFTYIGRYPDEETSEGIETIGPKDSKYLSEILPNFDVYLTASMYEAGANHVLEGLASGLPVVYAEGGGSIPEYVSSYGVEYNDLQGLLLSLDTIRNNYQLFKSRALGYNSNFDDTIQKYVDIILCES